MQGLPTTNYAANSVACKLWGLVESPIEMVLGQAIFDILNNFYDRWKCWVYSELEYTALIESKKTEYFGSFALVPQLNVPDIGRLDFAIFIPGLSKTLPMVVVECDGHDFHERTVQQASSDRRRDRKLQHCGIPILRFTGTDVVRGSTEFAQEIADFIDLHAGEKEHRWFQDNGIDIDGLIRAGKSFHAPYPWPRIRAGSELCARVREQERLRGSMQPD